MKTRISLLAAMLLVIGLVAGASAHVGDPPGTVYFAFQFEDDAIPTIDGNGDDWSFVPEFYWIPGEKWNLAQRGEGGGDFDPTEADFATFNPSAVYGWNDTSNRMYIFVQAIDDFHEIDRDNFWTWVDDDLEVRWSGAHIGTEDYIAGGDFGGEGNNRIEQLFAVPPIATGEYYYLNPGYDWALPGGPMMDFAYSFEGLEIGEGASTYWYELSSQIPWTIGSEDIADVVWTDLEEGHTSHAAAYLNDRDGEDSETFWTTGTQGNNVMQQDLTLAEIDDSVDQTATAVEGSSWGLIKAGFTK